MALKLYKRQDKQNICYILSQWTIINENIFDSGYKLKVEFKHRYTAYNCHNWVILSQIMYRQ